MATNGKIINVSIKRPAIATISTFFLITAYTVNDAAKDIEIKLVNSEIHGEIKSEGINLQKISGLMKRKTIDYDHKANSTDYKYSKEFKLKALSLEHMPTFLKQNVNKYSEWFDIDQ